MKILVTGGRGFIGHHLIERLLQIEEVEAVYSTTRDSDMNTCHPWQLPIVPSQQRHWEVTVDLEVESQCKYLFDRVRFDVIFHLAANPMVKEDAFRPTHISTTNTLVTHRLLSLCEPGTRFVFASSATVYGDLGQIGECKETTLPHPNSVYGATKVAGEALVTAFTESGKVQGTSLRLVANVGTHTTHGILHDLVRKLRSKSDTLDLLGSEPGSTKPYCHVRDTVDAFIMAGFKSWWQTQGVVNVSVSDGINVLQFADTVMKYIGIHKPIQFLGEKANWAGDNRLVSVSPQKALQLGWEPSQPTSQLAVAQACVDILEQERVV